ncbi:MAG TPA: CAP domain-containing protein [Steroidobacteraceae bacterium]|nr:CAP domain-containing protein [Gammaproteobacteria bacterium]HEV2284588.1 CAP domain-containing protein [Steroidobacteraceae bacterium]
MNRLDPGRLWGLLLIVSGLAAAPLARTDPLSVVQMLREGGCGGLVPAARPLHREARLDRAAEEWAGGHSLATATDLSGYRALNAQGLHATGSDDGLIQSLRRSQCRSVSGRDLTDIGVYRRGADSWVVLATATAAAPAPAYPAAPVTRWHTAEPAPAAPPTRPLSTTPAMESRALALVNAARARGARCGSQSFAPAPPLTLSGTLADVALGHASDMAQHDYFEHQDLTGHSPADRVRAAGYHEKLVGENIAYGPQSVDEVVRGWLESPGHCENIMDPRFAQMGVGLASGRAARKGLFWVQLLAEPRA